MKPTAIKTLALGATLAALALTAHAQPAGYKVTGHIAVPDGGWDYAAVDAAGRRLYVARAAAVTAVDLDSGKVTGELTPTSRGHAAIPLPGGRLLVTNGNSDTAVIVEGATGKVLTTLPAAKNPDGAIYDPASGLAFAIGHGAGGIVTFIDVAKAAVVGSVTTNGGALEFPAVDGAGRLWVNDEKASEVIAIDIKGQKVIAHHKLDGCEGPTGLIYIPGVDRLIATCDKVAAVIDPATGAVVDKLVVGDGPDAVFYDPTRKLAFVPGGESGDLTVISAASGKLKVVQTLKTAVGARTGAVDPKTGKVYLPVAKMIPPASGKGRSTPAPGSFELLVVSP